MSKMDWIIKSVSAGAPVFAAVTAPVSLIGGRKPTINYARSQTSTNWIASDRVFIKGGA
ncbi:hypothetical protein OR1_02367 [Geobacter sp. OR-1]|nr:hypothetical protein OR1_02367 [Geobacter sp. OR-1]